ncbi:MAG: FAD-dependent oxidoreductase [Lachnospiraceae bacterium]|jgi:fumarate reductase flavoprotein subunit|nr:FAD-dependent oxidoreductase [Lachnospiraceae bacterium]
MGKHRGKRLCCIAMAGFMTISLLACQSEAPDSTPAATSEGEKTTAAPAQTETAAPETTAPVSGNTFRAGTYEGTAPGRNGEVAVSVTVDESSILSVEVISHSETPVVSDNAVSLLPGLIVERQSLGVDTISGCTQTSKAILEAAAQALLQAGGKEEDLYKAGTEVIEQHMKPGTYYAEGYGMWPAKSTEGARYGAPKEIAPTKVAVTVDEKSIVSVEILESSDTPDFVAAVRNILPAAIVEHQSFNVDTVSGCTRTATNVLNCVTDCLTQAGADLAGFSTGVPRKTGTETHDTDIVIVGAGGFGIAAALSASEAGRNVILLEKTARLGGNTAYATGPFSVGSTRQIENGSVKTADEVFTEWMEQTNWKTNASLVYQILSESGATMDWLQDYWDQTDDDGFLSIPSGNGYEITWTLTKGIHKFDALYDQILKDRGVELMMLTEAVEVLMNEDGSVSGVRAVKQDGTEVIVNAPAVLIGTGGYAGNPEMLEEYVGSSAFYVKGMTSSTGDGIRMCLDAGAARHNEMSTAMSSFCANEYVDIYSSYLKYCNQVGCLTVDPSGERFINEELFVTASIQEAGSAMRRVGYMYVIMTQAEVDAMTTGGISALISEEDIAELGYRPRVLNIAFETFSDELQTMMDAGQAWKADSLEELGKVCPVDETIFAATVASYQEAIENKEDALFGKRESLLRNIDEGPYYAIRVIPAIDGTIGVIKINSNMQVLREGDLNPIPGLYCGGSDAAGYFSNPYTPYVGSTSCYALTGGRIAGMQADEYLTAIGR